MKKALCVVALLAFVAVASADIDLFLTQQTDQASTYIGTTTVVGSRFNQNVTLFKYSSQPGTGTANPGGLPHGPFNLGVATPGSPVTSTFYIWAKFSNIPQYDDGEGGMVPGFIQIYGLGFLNQANTGSRVVGAATLPQSAVYRQNDAANSIVRWGNTDPLPFPSTPSTTGAGTGAGVVAPKLLDGLQKTFGETDTYYSLLGAFQYTATGASQLLFGLANPLPFIAVRYLRPDGTVDQDWDTKVATPPASSFYPYLTINGLPYTSDSVGGTQPFVDISTTPEPASLVLLGLAGLLIRRR